MRLILNNITMEKEKTKVGAFLQKVAPTLLETAGTLTGISGLKDLGNMIKGSPDLSENDKNIALELLKLDIQDRESARAMQMAALGQDDVFSKRFIYYLAAFIMVSLMILLVMLFFVQIPEGNSEIVYMAIGIFMGIVSTVAAYFFGSSSGSKQKEEGLMQAIRNKRK